MLGRPGSGMVQWTTERVKI